MRATIESTRMPDAQCPHCNSELSGVTGAALTAGNKAPPPPRPKPGSVTLCCYCNSLLMFDAAMIPRAISDEQQRVILERVPLLREVMDAWKARNTQ